MFKFKNNKDANGNLTIDFLNSLKYIFNIDNFIETGTYNGKIAEICSSIFSNVYSIELNEKMYHDALQNYNNINNIKFYMGSSDKVLNDIIPSINGKNLFWLDAHYCGEGTAYGDGMTPIKAELEAIKNSEIKDCVIMIDDIRIFGSTVHDKEFFVLQNEYPSIQWINKKLLEINDNFNIYLIGDILIAYDKKYYLEISDTVKTATISRSYDGNNYSLNELYNAEIKLIETNDPEEIKLIKQTSTDQSNLELPTTEYHYYLWDGLLNIKHNSSKSIELFNKIINLEYKDNINKYIKLAKSYESI
jgi:hypothetical protein